MTIVSNLLTLNLYSVKACLQRGWLSLRRLLSISRVICDPDYHHSSCFSWRQQKSSSVGNGYKACKIICEMNFSLTSTSGYFWCNWKLLQHKSQEISEQLPFMFWSVQRWMMNLAPQSSIALSARFVALLPLADTCARGPCKMYSLVWSTAGFGSGCLTLKLSNLRYFIQKLCWFRLLYEVSFRVGTGLWSPGKCKH